MVPGHMEMACHLLESCLPASGSDSCQWLLSDGRFQGSRWQPFGCMMHTYGGSDARSCMHSISYWKGRNHIVFMGDERMRQLFIEFIALIDGDGSSELTDGHDSVIPLEMKSYQYENYTNRPVDYSEYHEHYEQAAIGLYTEFLYYPFLNEQYRDKLKELECLNHKSRVTSLVTGLALSEIPLPNVHDEGGDMKQLNSRVEKWNLDFEEAAKILENISAADTNVVWNLQEPVLNVSSPANEAIDRHNRAALEQFESSKVRLWKTTRLITQIFQWNSTLHNQTEHFELDSQILLNYLCNGNMYYQDGTCCTTTEKPTLLQFMTIVIFVMCISLCVIMFVVCWRDVKEVKTTAGSAVVDSTKTKVYHTRNIEATWKVSLFEIFRGFSRIGIIVGYAFLCDRTTFFMKENKNYTNLNFGFPLAYVILIGLFWAKDSEHTSILHRDQTDEWKGWMQIVILIYHFTGASRVLGVYMFVRCLVTAYVFLNAYGNFMYSWNTGDYSVHRYFTVVVRYNLLVICLCMVMNRPYQFYYFVPLITFWYTVMYLTAALWPRVNSHCVEKSLTRLWYLILKLIILLALITLLSSYEAIFEKIFSANPLKPLYITRENTVLDWKFRWSIDRYSSLCGILFAVFVVLAQKYNIIQDKDNESSLFRHDAVFWLAILFSLFSIVGYALVMLFMCDTKEQCNVIHPYISCLPVVGYIFLRNLAGPIRTLYSPFFAWFGKFALELFVVQYHIWLAADTHGILVLVPNHPVLNVAVTTFIFVCAAHELHAATKQVTNYLVPNTWIGLIKNIFIFCSIMVPVAIYSGAFDM
ncbi:N-acetylneuraminate 9-O-acetyltransferase-like isoform X2 [Watersipora subatra]|uniref:N-acetylneuraminate 9-O-acetyltransferase-like isoform X2 n=1 Tax=Watersipora subatra TaxID=2589382 RepID=UPI00355B0ACB